jgi:hypothetical protein
VPAEIIAAGGEAVAEHSDAAIGPGGMFHRQPAAQFGEVLEISLRGHVRLARPRMDPEVGCAGHR